MNYCPIVHFIRMFWLTEAELAMRICLFPLVALPVLTNSKHYGEGLVWFISMSCICYL